MDLMSDPREPNDPPSSAAGGGRSRRGQSVPDILYHGTTRGRAERFFQSGGVIPSQGRQVFLSTRESEAWRIAHRFNQEPAVLYVDAGRARREGVAIRRVRDGLFVADRVPARYVLNLRGGFREQISAGGLLLRRDRGGLGDRQRQA
jgi:RNA:NAD 2'-phosphotransferase (TPT1/KptA family)